MRWVHRSSFFVRPPPGGRVPLRGSHNQSLFVDSGWHGSVIVETEGTNESLADLQDRCGSGVFPPRATGSSSVKLARDPDDRMVFKVMRERRCVHDFLLSLARSNIIFQVGLGRYGFGLSVRKRNCYEVDVSLQMLHFILLRLFLLSISYSL